MDNLQDHAPAWLFSFVDLAFLLLIAMTQVQGDERNTLELGEIVVPHVSGRTALELPTGAPDRWQLRIHPAQAEMPPPYELVLPSEDREEVERLDARGLRRRLEILHARRGGKPVLAPHGDSRSEDLLAAVGLLDELWPGRRRATVLPLGGAR